MSKKCKKCNDMALEGKSLCFFHIYEKQRNRHKIVNGIKEAVVKVGPIIVAIGGAIINGLRKKR